MKADSRELILTEHEMVQDAQKRLLRAGVTVLSSEVPFGGRRIDLVFIDDKDCLVAVEFKLSKWRAAIDQASLHIVAVDRSYICIPHQRMHLIDISHAAQWGVGVFGFNASGWPFTEVLSAKEQSPWVSLKRRILDEVYVR